MWRFVWVFLFYSFGGYLLERWFAGRTHAEKQTRKGLIFLPLCPVYGLGIIAVLFLPNSWRAGWWLIPVSTVVTTAVEYFFHLACEKFLAVSFWDYDGVPGNLNGRVSLPFACAWGFLASGAIWLIQPLLMLLIPLIPWWVTFAITLFLAADVVCSVRLLYLTHDTEALHFRTLRGA